MTLDQRFPCIDDLERAALRRIPRFASEYLRGGIGREAGLRHNRTALDRVVFDPVYLREANTFPPDMSAELFGKRYDLPFGISPLGLSGLMWPRAVDILAKAAQKANIPMGLSHHATTHMSEFRRIAGPNGWFQMYPPHNADLRRAMLKEVQETGFEVLIVTVDIPTPTRRDRELRVDLSVPPRITPRTIWDVVTHPSWAFATATVGPPKFHNLLPYLPERQSLANQARSLLEMVSQPVTPDALRDIRAHWPGKLVVKGVMNVTDAQTALDCGADAVWVSNHGARQLDVALSPVEVLPAIRAALRPDVPIMADSGPRTGLDIARMLAQGADFVFLGRAFIFAVAALGARGGDHAIHILREELRSAMGQVGARSVHSLCTDGATGS